MLLMPILGEKTDARKVVRPILVEGRERHILGIRFPAGSLPAETVCLTIGKIVTYRMTEIARSSIGLTNLVLGSVGCT
jgi:hypothetical protein